MNCRWSCAGAVSAVSLCGVLLCGVSLLWDAGCSRPAANRARPRDSSRNWGTPAERTKVRQIYPYSLIPGGVQDSSEFAQQRVSERILTEHYRDLGTKLMPTSLRRDRWMYASYRIADAVYWTKNRILVHAGEDLLSDGKNMVRARCGNRLSETPQVPVKRFEPPVITTDRFTTEIVMLPPPELVPHPDLPLVPPLPAIVPSDVLPPERTAIPPDVSLTPVQPVSPYVPVAPVAPVVPIPPRPPAAYSSTPPVLVIPETSTWMLMLAGLIAVLILGRRRVVARDIVARDASGDADPRFLCSIRGRGDRTSN